MALMSETKADVRRPPRSSLLKRLLYGPGPSQVDSRVYKAMAKPIVGHLDPYFFKVFDETSKMLKVVFGTQNPMTFAVSGTGSSGMETAVANFVEPGTKVAVFANGYFCDRITEMAKRQGGEVVRFEKPWGEVFGDDEASDFCNASARKWWPTSRRRLQPAPSSPAKPSAPPPMPWAPWSSPTASPRSAPCR